MVSASVEKQYQSISSHPLFALALRCDVSTRSGTRTFLFYAGRILSNHALNGLFDVECGKERKTQVKLK